MRAHGVQMKAIVVASRPSTAELGILFEQYRDDPAMLKGGGGGKAARSGADDHDGGLRHHSLPAQPGAHTHEGVQIRHCLWSHIHCDSIFSTIHKIQRELSSWKTNPEANHRCNLLRPGRRNNCISPVAAPNISASGSSISC